MKTRYVLITFALGLGVTLALLLILGGRGTPAVLALSADEGAALALNEVEGVAEGHIEAPSAPAAELRVCPAGPPTCDYATVQAAVDDANDGDVIKVATGAYTDIHQRAGITQVVYISKTVTVRGGYTIANWTTPDPDANPTTLDAEGQGRVLYITGNISPTVEGLRITGGYVEASGGGIYNKDADLALTNTIITNNISSGINWPDGLGGGMSVWGGSVTLSKVQIISNSASYKGGGMSVWGGSVTLSGGQIIHNIAKGPTGWDGGGGMFVLGSATLNGVQVISNSAHSGGGLYVYLSDVTLSGGQILDNSAAWSGGGVFIWGSSGVTLNGGEIISNSARNGGGVLSYGTFTQTGVSTIAYNFASERGGGVFVGEGRATLSGGQISNNAASQGGGVYVENGQATLSEGHIVSNTADQDGGGILVQQSTANATLTNSVVADNRADGLGSGLYIGGGSSRLLHTTIARNSGGDGSGVYITGTTSTVALTNTILVNHTVGITCAASNTVTLNGVLWYSNTVNTGGTGAITITNEYTGDPAFAADGYHLTASSEAIDKGVNAGVDDDIDSEPRPAGVGYDIGADEYYHPALDVTKQADPNPVQAGALLTYIIRVTNTGNVDLHATVTDTLPAQVTPIGALSWTPTITAPGGVWTEQVMVTVTMDYSGTLTNVMRVTTDEGATGVYTKTSTAVVEYSIYLPVILKNSG